MPSTPTWGISASRPARALVAAVLALGLVATVAGPAAATDPASTSRTVTVTASNPARLDLFVAGGFRFQDPNWYACTSTSVMDMLNAIKLRGTGGANFIWIVRLGSAARDSILAWERTHHTQAGGNGSDPHGWRNALNYYGWGSVALGASSRVYDDQAYATYDQAIKAAVRALIRFRKPVGIAAWAGRHAQMITGYDGLVGNPFERDAAGRFTDAFSVAAVSLSDPLSSQALVNKRITYGELKSSANLKLRFRPYLETDSPYDDPYTPGTIAARDEWYGKFVIVAPVR
jgi:hypothetical protein